MSKWIVYSKDGLTERCSVRKLQYDAEFMGACSVTVSISSPTPILFSIGDFIEYRGERFELNYDPSVIKQSSYDTYGEGFTYDDVKFNSLSDELTRCEFLDYVKSDNLLHYSSLPNFSFFADNIYKLTERIKVNLDRVYTGDKAWTIVVHPEYINATNVNISVSSINCWEALALVKEYFDASFIIRGRTITVGTAGIAVGNVFGYGKGNGLVSIERNAEQDQAIVTRLRAYGSTRNMPAGYYHNYSENVPNNMAVQNLMLPSFPDTTLDPYIDSANVSELGVREGTLFFDGSGETEEIYPSMEGMTAEDLIAAGVETTATGDLDIVYSAEQIEDNGIFEPQEGEESVEIPTFTITLKDIGFDINDYLSASGNASISMKDGMCGGREFEIVSCEKDESNHYVLTCNRSEDTGLGLFFPYKDYQIKAGDKFVLLNIEMPDVYIKAASQRLLEAATAWLAKNDYIRYSYTPAIDNIWMQRQHDAAVEGGYASIHDTIKEGDLFLFEDADLGIDGSVIIDQLTIKEDSDDSYIPQYEITLRNDKAVGTIDRLQNQIDSIAAGGGQGGGYNSAQIQAFIKAYGEKYFLSKQKNDKTNYRLEAKEFQTLEAILSMIAGKGSIIQDGLIQTDRLEVRNSMTVMEIIFNRLSAMESNYAFSAAATIESIEEKVDGEGNAYYRLTFRKRWENDFHAFSMNDIIYGQFNNLATGGGNYYTSWMRVLEFSDTAANQVDVVLWDNDQVPGGVNYAPSTMMNVIHRGNTADADRQSYWYLSALDEKCLVWLEGVDAPILREENYYMILGKLKDLSIFDNLPINYKHSYMYARGAVVQDLFRVDFKGVVQKSENNRGQWSYEVAISDSPYRSTETSYDTVWYNGCKWQCISDNTLETPSYASSDWAFVEGNPSFEIDITSTNGDVFHIEETALTYEDGEYIPFTSLVVTGKMYNEDVTEHIADENVVWTRDSGIPNEDSEWAVLRANAGKTLSLTREDLGSKYPNITGMMFIATATIEDGVVAEPVAYRL